MPAVVDGNGPNYISAHSADVILSDIRPITLKADALRSINVLLDEFLHSILSTSRSLATEKLRASLLNVLPTSLGKEALLEAEVELRAYWERTGTNVPVEDDSRTFHLQWAFELLRLKCEAYSTLNEQDEDASVEARVNERFASTQSQPPKSVLVDPAALYLTAIIEAMCEHILSNVGRVAARDSSRTYATVNDLFVALCEDDSIYGLFRMMKVYEQIENMSKTPKTRRSKSFSRHDHTSASRTSSPQQDLTLVNSTSRSRQSSDGHSTIVLPSTSGSRTSFDKARAIRMFANKSGDGENHSITQSHKKSDSIRSESSRYPDEDAQSPAEDAAMLREFDDLMRSASTMKVSLTPDRLKTMEVYKQEKDLRNTGRRPTGHFPSNSTPDAISSSRSASQRAGARPVESINEDDESPKGRTRQASVATPPVPTTVNTRARSVSTSSGVVRKPVRSLSTKAAPSAFPNAAPADMVQHRGQTAPDQSGFPPRTRTKARNRDSLDLDDVMNGSDDEHEKPVRRSPAQTKTPSSPTPRQKPPHVVSARTRELMDFLAEGPPEAKLSKDGRELVDFLAQDPPNYGASAISLEGNKSQKGGGRLQRMISKLNLGNGEKPKGSSEMLRSPTSTPQRQTVVPKSSAGTLSSLANRPIPPRPPRPISPPSSIPSHDSSDENKSVRSPPRKLQTQATFEPPVPAEKPIAERPPAIVTAHAAPSPPVISHREISSHREQQQQPQLQAKEKPVYTRAPAPAFVHGNGPPTNGVLKVVTASKPPQEATVDVHPVIPTRKTSNPPSVPRKGPPPAVVSPTYAPSISEPDLRDMQRLMTNATTADECRLILDMYMARSGISREPKVQDVPYPSPSPSVVKHNPYIDGDGGAALENSLVELFLGSSASPSLPSQQPPGQLEEPVEGLPTESSNDIIATPTKVPSRDTRPHLNVSHNVSPVQSTPVVSIRA